MNQKILIGSRFLIKAKFRHKFKLSGSVAWAWSPSYLGDWSTRKIAWTLKFETRLGKIVRFLLNKFLFMSFVVSMWVTQGEELPIIIFMFLERMWGYSKIYLSLQLLMGLLFSFFAIRNDATACTNVCKFKLYMYAFFLTIRLREWCHLSILVNNKSILNTQS